MRTPLFCVAVAMSVLMASAWAAEPAKKPPVNNAVPPCDESAASRKPSCNMDRGSVNAPPEMPHDGGVIVPPEIPAEGLPNRELPHREKQQLEPVSPPAQENPLRN